MPRGAKAAAAEAAWSQRCGALFEDLRRPARAMVARAYGKALSEEEIEDVYSAAWTATLSALRKRGPQMSEHELRAYLFTAVATHASKEMRRRSRKPTGTLEEVPGHVATDQHQPSPDERAIGAESQGIARDLLSSLPPRRRAVMLLRYGWGLSPEEVCCLIKGLSRRAYRKEISRGVEQLIERLGQVDSGEWCRARAPMLRDYLAGTADEATRLQVEQHLRHCRSCSTLAGRMRVELNDLSGIVILGAAAGLVTGARGPVLDRLAGALQGSRESASAVAEKVDLALGTVPASSGGRGVGAGGAGLTAKIAALGGAGKTAVACIGAGAAATACVAAGVVPGLTAADLGLGGEGRAKEAHAPAARKVARTSYLPAGPPAPAPSTPTRDPVPPPTSPESEQAPPPISEGEPAEAVTPGPPTQEFAPLSTPPPASTTDGGGEPSGAPGGGSIAGSEWGP